MSNRKLARPKIIILHVKLHSKLSNSNNLQFWKYSLNAVTIFFYFVTRTVPQISLKACLSVLQFHSWRMPICGVQILVLKKVFVLAIPSDKTLLRTEL